MAKKDQRFEVVLSEGNELATAGYRMILVDKVTGVHYLFVKSGYGGGLTPLVDCNGDVIISKDYEEGE